MTAQPTAPQGTTRRAGAASHGEVDWPAINWQRAETTVRRLQARIVKATQAGRWNKVRALQRLLTHSFSGKTLAVRRVTENRGKKTAGVDGVTWDTSAQKATAVRQMRRRGYRPSPLRRIYIPKKNGKLRPLGIPTMADRAMQALYLLALDPIAETTGDPNSYGFRKERSAADAIEQCFIALAKTNSAEWVLEGDIKSCFDEISHDWLLANVPTDKVILRKWLKAGFMDKQVWHRTEDGTPQGGIISPVLANLALDGLERQLRQAFPQQVGPATRRQTTRVNFIRYADDFVITGRSKEQLENEVLPLVQTFMQGRGLELSREKTVITHIDTGFDFLGQNVRKYGGKMLIKPAKSNLKALTAKVRGIIRANKQTSTGKLILKLNPVIRGWAQYHRHIVSRDTFEYVDYAVYRALWQWAKRRHPQKNAHWIRKTYFLTKGSRNWVFSGEHEGRERQLFLASDVRIRRHIKVKGKANPYDPEWEPYLERRLDVKMDATLAGRRQLLALWKRQNGRCLRCDRPITTITGWHSHHVLWRSRGGKDGLANRELYHPTCHIQLHTLENRMHAASHTHKKGRS